MALFTSFDGVDNNGIRAEVNVQVGTGRVKEIVPRGKPSPDGTYRNVEVVFDPDNPLLKRKVYALLDTTASELYNYAQEALADQRTVTFRIESQRKRGVDRTISFADLQHAEQVVRILAAIDTVMSHEAKTDPAEDPSKDNPSALEQNRAKATAVSTTVGTPGYDRSTVLAAVAAATAHNAQGVVDALTAQALLAGVEPDDLFPTIPDYGSVEVAHALKAETFALEHLIEFYSAPVTPRSKEDPVEVSDSMIAQAASLGLTLLSVADDIQQRACRLTEADRRQTSYTHALDLALNAIDTRYNFPIGRDEEEIASWRDKVVGETSERLYGVGCIAYGRLPESDTHDGETAVHITNTSPLEAPPATEPPHEEEPRPVDTVPAEEATTSTPSPVEAPAEDEVLSVDEVAAMLDATVTEPTNAEVAADAASETVSLGFQPVSPRLSPDDAGFQAPDADLVGRIRAICSDANISDFAAISNWLEANVGSRNARTVHAPLLEEFATYYETQGSEIVKRDVIIA